MNNKIFILDDEPMFLDWIVDFSESLDCSVTFFTSINDAHEHLKSVDTRNEYAAFIIDLNVPVSAELESVIKQKPEVYHEFRGLFIAQQARTLGVNGNKIIVYSVHDKPEVNDICARLNISYIPKGRAKTLKDKLRTIIKVDKPKA